MDMYQHNKMNVTHSFCKPRSPTKRCTMLVLLGGSLIVGLACIASKSVITAVSISDETVQLKFPTPTQKLPENVVTPEGAKTIAFGTDNWILPWFIGDKFGKRLNRDKPCVLIPNATEADGVMFCKTFLNFSEKYLDSHRSHEHPGQLWMVETIESPMTSALYTGITSWKKRLNDVFNFADSYTPDVDFYGDRSIGFYGKIMNKTKAEKQESKGRGKSTYLGQKTGLVTGMISNCHNMNSGRIEYVKELHKHVTTDGHTMRVYGSCFNEDGSTCKLGCTQCVDEKTEECKFSELGKKYKFYLSFENSLCWMYITEKFWKNALQNDMVPIVNGGLSKEDYTKVAPPHSFIHVDDFDSPKELAEYLIRLDSDDAAYNEYFKWRETHTILGGIEKWEPNNDHVRYCDFCKMLHDEANFKRNHRKRINFAAVYGIKDNCRPPDKRWISTIEDWRVKSLFQKDYDS